MRESNERLCLANDASEEVGLPDLCELAPVESLPVDRNCGDRGMTKVISKPGTEFTRDLENEDSSVRATHWKMTRHAYGFHHHGASSCMFLTAFNPFSVIWTVCVIAKYHGNSLTSRSGPSG